MGSWSTEQHAAVDGDESAADDDVKSAASWPRKFQELLRWFRRAERSKARQAAGAEGCSTAGGAKAAVQQVWRPSASPKPMLPSRGRIQLQGVQQTRSRFEDVPLEDTSSRRHHMQMLRGSRTLQSRMHLERRSLRKVRKKRAPPPGLQMPPPGMHQRLRKLLNRQPLPHRNQQSSNTRSSPRPRQHPWRCRRGIPGGRTAARNAA